MRYLLVSLLWVFSGLQAVQAQTIDFISDLNGRYGSTDYNSRVHKAIAAIKSDRPMLVVSTGDLVAGQKTNLDNPALQAMWDGFNQAVTQPLSDAGIPLAIAVGNHDGSAMQGFTRERELFSSQWQNRQPAGLLPESEWPRRYGLIMQDILLVAFDGTRPGEQPSSELDFLETILGRHGPDARAIIVFSHLPIWPFAKGRESDTLADPRLLNLLHRNRVTVYASGHHHAFWAGTDSAGMMHLAVGSLGGSTRELVGTDQRQPFSFVRMTLEDGQIHVHALPASDFTHPLDAHSLPDTIEGPLGVLNRSLHVSVQSGSQPVATTGDR